MSFKDAFIATFVKEFYPECDAVRLTTRIKEDLARDAQLFWKLVPLQPTSANDGALPLDIFSCAFWDLTCHGEYGLKGILFPYLFSRRKTQPGYKGVDMDDYFERCMCTLLYLEASQVKYRPHHACTCTTFEEELSIGMSAAWSGKFA